MQLLAAGEGAQLNNILAASYFFTGCEYNPMTGDKRKT